MNRKTMLGTGFLGLVSGLVAHAQDNQALSSQRALANLDNSRQVIIEVDPLIGNTCYGRPCPKEDLNNCDDAVIE